VHHQNPTASAHALGVIAAMQQVKEVRDRLQTDLSDLWRNRQGCHPATKSTMSTLRHVIGLLDGIEIEETGGSEAGTEEANT
jgi:hypothetical protein